LHMSLVGLRDMSLIETPPRDRLAIQTVVAPFQEDLVRRAIENEMAREGQVYFIHNRVESIYSLATLVSKLVPKARVVVGHGQMGEKELESVMLERAVSRLKGGEAARQLRTRLNLGLDVRIPENCIPRENLGLRTYKRISSMSTEDEKRDVRQELEDRCRAPPSSVDNLLEYA